MDSGRSVSDNYSKGLRSRQQIIDAALALFAEHGIGAVSMRAIAKAAGQANVSAPHYYFGTKLALVRAILEQIHQRISLQRDSVMQQLQALDPQKPDYVRQLLSTAFAPHLGLLEQGEWGQQAIRLLALVSWNAGEEGHKALIEPFADDIITIVNLLSQGLPNIPQALLRLRFMFAMDNMLHGLADLPILKHSPFGDLLGPNQDHTPTVLREFIAYIAAGISQP